MKSIDIRCTCGSSIQFRDDAESVINPQTGKPDSRGRLFLIQVQADEWLDRHQPCVIASVKARSFSNKKQKEKDT